MRISIVDYLYIVLGRISLCFNWLRKFLGDQSKWTPWAIIDNELDKTVLMQKIPKSLLIGWDDSGIIFPLYSFLTDSLWRVQEFSFFRKHSHLFHPPVLYFGCGDGSFASVLTKEFEYGINIDMTDLHITKQRGIYQSVLKAENNKIPLPDNSINSIISNSVLEHLTELEVNLRELHRILQPHGFLICLVCR